MVRTLTKSDLQVIERKGGSVERIESESIQIPGLEKIAEHFHQMKHEQAEAYKAASAAKLAKLDELVKVIEKAAQASGNEKEVAQILLQIKREHSTVVSEHKALKEVAHVHEPCEYLLTFERDQRNLIDGTKGIRFAPVKE